MKFSYEVSKLALTDLDEIWQYTAEQWSKQQANKYYKDIFQAIHEICSNPEMGKSISEVKEGHRSLIAKSHMIVYKIDKGRILIDRILHQRMNIENHLDE